MSYEVVENNEVYKGKIFSVNRDKVMMPNGNAATREIVIRGNAACVVPYDKDGFITFVRQYRHAAKNMMLEIPAGMLEEGEDPKTAAIRELEEETGLKTDDVFFVNYMYASIGICTERIYIYIADNLYEGKQNLDPDEFVEIEKYTLDQSIDMIFKGEIVDSKTIVGIFALKEYLSMKNK